MVTWSKSAKRRFGNCNAADSLSYSFWTQSIYNWYICFSSCSNSRASHKITCYHKRALKTQLVPTNVYSNHLVFHKHVFKTMDPTRRNTLHLHIQLNFKKVYGNKRKWLQIYVHKIFVVITSLQNGTTQPDWGPQWVVQNQTVKALRSLKETSGEIHLYLFPLPYIYIVYSFVFFKILIFVFGCQTLLWTLFWRRMVPHFVVSIKFVARSHGAVQSWIHQALWNSATIFMRRQHLSSVFLPANISDATHMCSSHGRTIFISGCASLQFHAHVSESGTAVL